MRFFKIHILPLLLALLMLNLSSALAATDTHNGLELTVTTDKSSYAAGEPVSATVKLTNTGAEAVKNVTIHVQGPANYVPADERDASRELSRLGAGDSASMHVTFNPYGTPVTGDAAPIVQWIVLAGVFGGLFALLLVRNRLARRTMSLLMTLTFAFSGVTMVGSAKADTVEHDYSFTVTEPVTIDGVLSEVMVSVSYTATGAVTREAWIRALMDVMGIPVDQSAIVTFNDFDDADNAKALQTAINAGILPTETDRDYVQLVRPKELATRDFVAYTAYLALQMQYVGTDPFECVDLSSVQHPEAARMAVAIGMLELVNGFFQPSKAITEAEKAASIAAIRKQVTVDLDSEGSYVQFVPGVTEATLHFEVDAENMTITVYDPSIVEGWVEDGVYVLYSTNPLQSDLAIKVVSISVYPDFAVIRYTQPQINEVLDSFDVRGVSSSEGYFIPAEGVTVQPKGVSAVSKGSTSGTVNLYQPLEITVGNVSGTLTVESLEYRLSASGTWRFPFVSVDEVYVALNSNFELSGTLLGLEVEGKLLGHISVPLGYGFNAYGEVYLGLDGSVSVTMNVGFDVKAGVQYTSSQFIKPVRDIDVSEISVKLEGEVFVGLGLEVGVDWLGFDLLSSGVETGIAFNAERTLAQYGLDNNEWCLDVNAYWYLKLMAAILPEFDGPEFEREVMNENNSLWRKNFHMEETGKVAECTRGKGKYEGYVVDAETGEPIYHAKIVLYKRNANFPEDTTFTDSDGYFVGTQQGAGTYKLRVTAAGYTPYECTLDIIGGSVTQVETQMMLSRETTDSSLLSGTVSGTVTNAMTGEPLSGVTVSIYSMALPSVGALVATVRTNSSGYYSTTLPFGMYEVTFAKDEYLPNGRFLTVFGNHSNFNTSLNPENQSAEINSLRAVLHWGSTPRDLDSHLVGPQGSGRFHIYFANATALNANLDVDITTGYGPETTTITQNEEGIYSFYVHDYTNKNSTSSTAMSYSGAYIVLYNGTDRLFTITVPEGRAGTVWHVFDYDGKTRQITLVNEFSYESNPSSVGTSGYSTYDRNVNLEKNYDKKVFTD